MSYVKTDSEQLLLDDLQIEHSKYCFIREGISENNYLSSLERSLNTLGLLEPLVVHSDTRGEIHLVDGFKRAVLLKRNGARHCRVKVLSSETPLDYILNLLFLSQSHRISFSFVSRASFVNLCLDLGLENKQIINQFLPLLGFEGHETIMRNCAKVIKLPKLVLEFCDKKRLSMKQCVHLTHFSDELLTIVFSWKDILNLTVSLIEELLEGLETILRRESLDLYVLLKELGVDDLLMASISPQVKTEKLRRKIKIKKYPVLSRVNEKIEKTKNEMNLPCHVLLYRDQSIENHKLDFKIHIKKIEDLETALEKLQQTKTSVEKILEAL
ncbi:MAG: ParB N-terminal domain-containing protein [Bdellovibrio sp.]|nr:ParB N-terminal domain-containing protein [Bdellovibrio sp.]